jgi:hypothetical protein
MARWASRVAIVGALIQVGYGLLACVYRYPTIIDRPFEALWAAANLGMIANIVTWLSIKVATRRLALVGGLLAIAGHAFRVVISLIIQARPDAAVDTPIVVTIMLSFAGLALLGTATLRARQLTGRAACAPLFVLAGGLAAVPFYSFDKVVHFILLGLLWGSAWLHMALVGHRQAVATADLRGRRRPVGQQSAPAPVAARDVVRRPVAHDVRRDVWRGRHRHHHGRDLTS